VPLGDDFRWETDKEIRNQFDNYFRLIDYMNSHPEMKIHVSSDERWFGLPVLVHGSILLCSGNFEQCTP
jgi:hypothetical protein